MTSDKGILIKNIYYMLTYAFQSLRQSNYDKVAAEEFENIHDMFSAILGKGVASQLKQGLYREYILQEEELSVLRGKLNIQGTIRNKIQHKQKEYPEQVYELCYKDISESCARAKDRREYKKITKNIAQLIKWKGNDTAKSLIEELKQRYPRKPALLDELEKVEKKL